MGGDGASLDDELGKHVWALLNDEEFMATLTDAELKQAVDILRGAHERKMRGD